MSDKPKYVEIQPRLREDLEKALSSSDDNEICNALYSAAHHEAGWRWSQEQCLKMLDHESLLVRSTALIALGEIALFRGHLDLETALPRIHRASSDPALAPFAEDALDNIRAARLPQCP
jgi:hypothetical protein